jgi:hypothetical protein
MRRALLLFALGIALAPACKQDRDNTKIIVAVWSDLSVGSEIDAVRIEVQGPTEQGAKTFPLTASNQLPVRLELVPEGDKSMSITVRAVGLRNLDEVAAQTARVRFVSGQALLLKLFLGRACAGKTCTGDFTCAQGACDQPIAVPGLPVYDPKNLHAPDAGVKPDSSGAIDTVPALDSKGTDLRPVESNAVEAGAEAPLDVPITGSGGTGGSPGLDGPSGSGGAGGGRGTGGALGAGGSTGIDAPTIDAVTLDGSDAPMGGGGVSLDGGAGGKTGTGGVIGAGGTGGAGGASGTGGTTGMELCVFGSSRFGNCKFGP